MLFEEAKWVGNQLLNICDAKSKVLNIGSSSLRSRTIVQPHMADFVFNPLSEKGVNVIHTDMKDDEGVDLVGDLTDPDFIKELNTLEIDCVLCSNLLEHIENKSILIDAINEIVPEGGYCLLTVPHVYPYHLDPIDTMYRPTPTELAKLFDSYSVIKQECVVATRKSKDKVDRNYFHMLKNNPSLGFRMIARSFMPFYKYQVWKNTVKDLSKMFKPFQVSCVVLQKKTT